MTGIIHFEMNVPAELALKDAGPGKPIEGRYGNRVMYTLADNRVIYVAPIVAHRISELGIQPGELFQVCKQVRRQGTQRLIEWQVQRLPYELETKLQRELTESIAAAQTATPWEPIVPSSKTPPPSLRPIENGSGNGNPASDAQTGDGLQQVVDTDCACPQETPVQPPINTPTPTLPISNASLNGFPSSASKNGNNPPPVITKLEHALKTAISAAYNAEKYGAELGYVVRFDADAIKSMAITVLINMSEGGRR